jgi:DNA-binding beta-propeller fold protein YncE
MTAVRMAVRTATGQRAYEVVEGFFQRPKLWPFVEVADVDVDKHDNVYVFNRGPHPVMIFDKNGKFLDSWGELGGHGFRAPHGISVGPDGSVLTADRGNHLVQKWTGDGKLLMTLGRENYNAPEHSGEPFSRPTHITVASNGDYYVSDGYGNSHVHCFDPSGNHKFSFGGHGSGPGEFDVIHSVFVDRTDGDKLYCADRWNNRVQFFTPKGDYLGQWTNLIHPNSVRRGPDGNFVIGELHHRVSVLSPDGKVVARWSEDAAIEDVPVGGGLPTSPARNPMLRGKVMHEPGAGFVAAPHGITVDSEGSIYLADVAESYCGIDRGDRCIQKFVPL